MEYSIKWQMNFLWEKMTLDHNKSAMKVKTGKVTEDVFLSIWNLEFPHFVCCKQFCEHSYFIFDYLSKCISLE